MFSRAEIDTEFVMQLVGAIEIDGMPGVRSKKITRIIYDTLLNIICCACTVINQAYDWVRDDGTDCIVLCRFPALVANNC